MSNRPGDSSAAPLVVDPKRVPRIALCGGATMPMVGFGTFGSDHATPAQVAQAVLGAAKAGYRHFDCASVYGNQREIGEALSQVMREGVPRDELWITSKLWNDMHAPADAVRSCEQSLADLRLEYLDLFLIHWPFPNHHPPGCDVHARNPHAVPYSHDRYMETWRALEGLVDRGLARHIGTSNMTIPKLEPLVRDARIQPAVNEMELHPHFQQPELFDFVVGHGIVPVAYSPLGSPNRPLRDRTPEDTVDLDDPGIVAIARAHGIHPASVCLKWAVQRGSVPIPFSTNPRNSTSNLACVTTDPLTADEMAAIARTDRGCRLIKGQVFLWETARGWEDLWDLDGSITRG